ncbi:MAG: TonB-dependent receptor [Bacteroidota bacterium]
MNRILCIGVMILLNSMGLAQTDLPISVEFRGEELKEAFNYLEEKYGLSFAYQESVVNGKATYANLKDINLEEALQKLLSPHNLNFEVLREKFVLIKQDTAVQVPAQTLCGRIWDKGDQAPLGYASVYVKRNRKGLIADSEGNFAFTVRYLPSDTLVVQYVGYAKLQIPIGPWENCRNIFLSPQTLELEGVLIAEYLTMGIEKDPRSSAIQLIPSRMGVLPGMVEPDILLGVQQLPGVTSPEETTSGIHIRGGTPDQNLVLWNGIPIYQTGHFYGMISAFNPYIVDRVDVFRGGFDASYGNRVSGVLDIKTHETIPKKLEGGVGMNLTHGHFFLKAPVVKEKLGINLSLRRSFIDFLPSPTFSQYQKRVFQGTRIQQIGQIANEFDEVIIPIEEFSFDDFSLSLHYQPSPRDHLKASLFTSNNQLDYRVENHFDSVGLADFLEQTNGGISLSWEHAWRKGHETHLRLYSSEYTYRYETEYFSLESDPNLSWASQSNSVVDVGAELSQKWVMGQGHTLQIGYAWNALGLDFAFLGLEVGQDTAREVRSPGLFTHSLFGGYTYEKPKRWRLNLGLRYAQYPLIPHLQVEPRMSLDMHLGQRWKLMVQAGRYKQFLSQLIIPLNEIGVGNQLWMLSHGEEIPLIRSNQLGMGLSYDHQGWQIEVDVYGRALKGLTTLSAAFEDVPESGFSVGNARIRGVDLLVRKRWKDYRTWMSYTLSQVGYRFPELTDRTFPATHDRRHVASWVHIYEDGPWEFSIGWNYASGKPFTPLSGSEIQPLEPGESGEPRVVLKPILGSPNSRRLPDYHRLDFSTQFSFPQDPQAGWKATLGLSILNVYDRANLLSRQFLPRQIRENELPSAEILLLEKVLLRRTPNLMVRFQW